jgi:hypothetical protein
MKADKFEEQLRVLPLRSLPAGWREEILGAALGRRAAEPVPREPERAPWWRAWLWPHQAAWAGVVAAWVCILALNHASRWEPPVFPDSSPHSYRAGFILAENRRCLNALLSEPERESGPLRSPGAVSPRSTLPLTNRFA